MPTAVWTGTISFGLVTLPVRLYPATEPKDVRFHLYDRSGRRVRYRRVVEGPDEAPPLGDDPSAIPADEVEAERTIAHPEPTAPEAEASVEAPIEWEDVVRGRENDLGELVTISREELEQVRPERSRSIEIEDFAELSDIDPVYFEKSYYVVPRSVQEAKPYVLLHRAMREAGRVGIGRFVLRTKPHLVAIRPMEQVLALETLFFGDEVREPAMLMPSLNGIGIDDKELDIAISLIEVLKREWDPGAYSDTYREELLRILSEKTPARRAEPEVEPASTSAVEALMEALKQSVEVAKRTERRPKRAG